VRVLQLHSSCLVFVSPSPVLFVVLRFRVDVSKASRLLFAFCARVNAATVSRMLCALRVLLFSVFIVILLLVVKVCPLPVFFIRFGLLTIVFTALVICIFPVLEGKCRAAVVVVVDLLVVVGVCRLSFVLHFRVNTLMASRMLLNTTKVSFLCLALYFLYVLLTSSLWIFVSLISRSSSTSLLSSSQSAQENVVFFLKVEHFSLLLAVVVVVVASVDFIEALFAFEMRGSTL